MVLTLTFVLGALAAITLAGLVVRDRLRLAWSFGLYLLVVAIFSTLVALWPSHFRTWPYWLGMEITHTSMKVSLALELSGLLFRSFPTAGRVARFGLLAILVGATAWVTSATPGSLSAWVGVAIPRIKCGEALLLTWLLVVVLWYRVPLHFLHKVILMALAPYLLIFSVVFQALETFGWAGGTLPWTSLNMLASTAMLAAWLYAAWRPEERKEVQPSVAKVVQPWA